MQRDDHRRSRGAGRLAIGLLAAGLAPSAAFADAAVSPGGLSARVAACDAGHGKAGVSETPMFPIIAGQP